MEVSDDPATPAAAAAPALEAARTPWTFLTNHAHVMIAIDRDPDLRQREISDLVGITEGAVQRILHELEAAGYLRRERIGRRNRYHVERGRPLRHRLEHDHTIDEILATVNHPVDLSDDGPRPTRHHRNGAP